MRTKNLLRSFPGSYLSGHDATLGWTRTYLQGQPCGATNYTTIACFDHLLLEALRIILGSIFPHQIEMFQEVGLLVIGEEVYIVIMKNATEL